MKHVERLPKPVTEEEEREPPTAVSEGEKEFPLPLNIVIQVVGSRGDIQPFIALGKELQQHGHRVRLATHLAFRNDINSEGLEFFNIGGNPEELMAFMVQNPGLLPGIRTIRSGAIQKHRREMNDIFSGCWRSCVETGDGTGLHQVTHDSHSDAVDDSTRPFVADAIITNSALRNLRFLTKSFFWKSAPTTGFSRGFRASFTMVAPEPQLQDYF